MLGHGPSPFITLVMKGVATMAFLFQKKRWLKITGALIIGILLCTLAYARVTNADGSAAAAYAQVCRRVKHLPRRATRSTIIHELGEPNSQVLTPGKHRQTMHWRYPKVGQVTIVLDHDRVISIQKKAY